MKKAYILIEVLLCLVLILLFSSVCIISTGRGSGATLQIKTDDFLTLNRFARCHAEISGKKSKLLLENNKVKLLLEDNFGNTYEIPTMRDMVNNLNDNASFECENSNFIVYLPDGSIEKSDQVTLKLDECETNLALITIGEFNQVNVIYTNFLSNSKVFNN